MENEIWKAIPNYEGLYDASNQGRIRSLTHYAKNGRKFPGKILKGSINSTGRPLVILYKGAKKKTENVHRLVALAFMGVSDGLIVRHLNGNMTDNKLKNLSYGTPKQNSADRIKHGTMHYGEKVHNAKLTNAQVIEIRRVHKFRCYTNGTMALAKKYKVSPSTISAILHGQNWSSIDFERGAGKHE